MKQHRQTRIAALALLLAGVAFPLNATFAQDVTATPPTVNAPPPTITAPSPAVLPPPVLVTPPSTTAITRTPPAEVTAEPATRAQAPATRRATASPRAPAATTRRAPAPVQAEPAQAAPTPIADPTPVAQPLPPVAAPAPALDPSVGPSETQPADPTPWPWLLAAAALAVVAGLWFALRRRRRTEDVVSEEYQEEPIVVEGAREPVFSRPALAAAMPLAATDSSVDAPEPIEHSADAAATVDKVSEGEPDAADVEALAASSDAPSNRPWLEFLMRPIRAGTTGDDAVVEFELTVGNTGSQPARDVRISTWMFAAGSAAESDMERMLIEPPAEARLSEVTIQPGDGHRVDASLALPRSGLPDSVLPVIVADARYTLPDGSEGRTSASFEVGLPGGDELGPFPTDRASGLFESVEARLHGELERV
ncbi:MAG: hypothetical protein ACXWU2_09030 [Allosphingosinicella sp.]